MQSGATGFMALLGLTIRNTAQTFGVSLSAAPTAARAQTFQDADGVIALTSDIPGVGVTTDAAGLGITNSGGRLSSAGAPAAPGSNAPTFNHVLIAPVALITTLEAGQTIRLLRNGAPIMTFDATITGWTLPNDAVWVPIGVAGDVYTVDRSGAAAVGLVEFGIAPTP